MSLLRRRPDIVVPALYAATAAAWILVSDHLTQAMSPSPADFARWSMLKGLAFVLWTGVALYGVLRTAWKRFDSSGCALVSDAGSCVVLRKPLAAVAALRTSRGTGPGAARLQRLNRVLRFVDGCREALARADAPAVLHAEICRCALELGGYEVAIVARGDRGRGEPTRVAQRSVDDSAVEGAWRDPRCGSALVDAALRTGRVAVARVGTPQRAELVPAPEDARAAVALPLCEAGPCDAALLLVSRDPEDFDEAIVPPLAEIAFHVAVRLGSLRTRALLDAVIEHTPIPFYVLTDDGRIVLLNAAWEDSAGRRRDEAIGKRIDEVFPSEVAAPWLATNERVLASGCAVRVLETVDVHGQRRSFETVKFPVQHRDRWFDAVAGFSIDVTDERASRNELRALAARVLTIREEEKARIARDLHDELGQALTALQLEVGWVERRLRDPAGTSRAALLARAATISSQVAHLAASVQRIASELRPALLDQLGLGPALQYKARHFGARTGISCESRIPDELPQLPRGAEIALYRIAQEALTNVARHAHATWARVTLARDGGGVILSVEDDGCGIQSRGEHAQALGLLGMKERAAALDGEVRIERREGGGTVVIARVPSSDGGIDAGTA